MAPRKIQKGGSIQGKRMDKTKQRFEIGSRVICKSWKDLLHAALMLTSKGYKIEIESLIGSMDMTEIVLTITALPEKEWSE